MDAITLANCAVFHYKPTADPIGPDLLGEDSLVHIDSYDRFSIGMDNFRLTSEAMLPPGPRTWIVISTGLKVTRTSAYGGCVFLSTSRARSGRI